MVVLEVPQGTLYKLMYIHFFTMLYFCLNPWFCHLCFIGFVNTIVHELQYFEIYQTTTSRENHKNTIVYCLSLWHQ